MNKFTLLTYFDVGWHLAFRFFGLQFLCFVIIARFAFRSIPTIEFKIPIWRTHTIHLLFTNRQWKKIYEARKKYAFQAHIRTYNSLTLYDFRQPLFTHYVPHHHTFINDFFRCLLFLFFFLLGLVHDSLYFNFQPGRFKLQLLKTFIFVA